MVRRHPVHLYIPNCKNRSKGKGSLEIVLGKSDSTRFCDWMPMFWEGKIPVEAVLQLHGKFSRGQKHLLFRSLSSRCKFTGLNLTSGRRCYGNWKPQSLRNSKRKGKGLPLQAWCDSWRSRRLRLLDRLDIRHYEGGKVVTLTHRPPSPSGGFLVLISRGCVYPRTHGSVGSFGKNSHRHHWGFFFCSLCFISAISLS